MFVECYGGLILSRRKAGDFWEKWNECLTFVLSFEKTGCISSGGSLRVRAAGGNANNGANAGASYTNANNTATNANANYSSPLYFANGLY